MNFEFHHFSAVLGILRKSGRKKIPVAGDFIFYTLTLFLQLQSNHRLDMVRMGKHVHRYHVRQHILPIRQKEVQIPNQRRRITADINDFPSSKCQDIRRGARVHSVARRINNECVSRLSVIQVFLEKFFYRRLNGFEIGHPVESCVDYRIRARIRHEFHGTYPVEEIREQDSDGSRSRIEIQQGSARRFHEGNHQGIEDFRPNGIGLEKTFRPYFKRFTK